MRLLRTALTLALLLTPCMGFAALPPSALDPTFGDGGVVRLDFDSPQGRGDLMVIQPDGRIVTAGTSGDGRLLLTRHLTNGSLDPSFGDAGVVMLSGYIVEPVDLALQSDGKLVLVNSNMAVVRLLENGAPDPSFGVDGKAYAAVPGDSPTSVAVVAQDDGKVVIGGNQRNTSVFIDQFLLVRLDASGVLDPSFGQGGVVRTSPSGLGSGADGLYALALQPDGRILAGGFSIKYNEYFAMVVVRYLPDGTLDASFGNGGIALGAPGIAKKLALAPDGGVLAACQPENYYGGFCAARWLPDGTADATFDGDGAATIDLVSHPLEPAWLTVSAVAGQSDGKVVAAGRSSSGPTLVRLTNTGAPDPSFGVAGIAVIAATPGWGLNGVVLQADGKIVTLGGQGGLVLTRLAGGVCRNGTVDGGEACDDGNAVDGDGCDTNCTPTGCGNGIVTAGEACDDGNAADGDCCSSACAATVAGAACDDGDACTLDDACDGAGRCTVTASVACDDGTTCTLDACDPRTGMCINEQDLYWGSWQCIETFRRLDWLPRAYSAYAHYGASEAHFGAEVVIVGDKLLVLARDEEDPNAQLFELATGEFLHTFHDPTPFDRTFGPIAAFGADFLMAAESALGQASRGVGEVDLYDGTTYDLRRAFIDPTPETFGFGAAILGHDGKVLALDEGDGVIYVFDAATGALLSTLESPDDRRLRGPLTPLGDDVLVPTDHAVHRFDLATGAIVRSFDDPTPAAGAFPQAIVTLGPDVLIGGHGEGVVYLFDGDTGAVKRTFTDPGGRGFGFGETIAAAGGDVVVGRGFDRVHVFDGATGALRLTLVDPLPSGRGCFGESILPLGRGGLIVNDPCWGGFRDDTWGLFHLYDRATGTLVGRARNDYGQYEDRFMARAASGDTIVATRHGDDNGGVDVYHLCRPSDAAGAPCDDGNLLPGDGCDPNCTLTACGNGLASAGEQCDDADTDDDDGCHNDCTINPCAGGCTPCERCDPDLGCRPAIMDACRRPTEVDAAELLITSSSRGRATRLVWKWLRGEATPLEAFGRPEVGDDYNLCVFDQSSPPHIVLEVAAPGGDTCSKSPCWRRDERNDRLTYAKRNAADGIRRAVLQAGDAGAATITVRTGDLPFVWSPARFAVPLTVQLQGSHGACFEARFAADAVGTRGTTRVRAKGR